MFKSLHTSNNHFGVIDFQPILLSLIEVHHPLPLVISLPLGLPSCYRRSWIILLSMPSPRFCVYLGMRLELALNVNPANTCTKIF